MFMYHTKYMNIIETIGIFLLSKTKSVIFIAVFY